MIETIVYDRITVPHELQFGRILPQEHAVAGVKPQMEQSVYTFHLAEFPENDQPSGGISSRISPSEMAIAYLRVENYPKNESDLVTFSWWRCDGDHRENIATVRGIDSPEEPGWINWWSDDWSFIGHFDWEIATPGKYGVDVKTVWGDARISFEVT